MTSVAQLATKGKITEKKPISAAKNGVAEIHLWNFDIDSSELKLEHIKWIHRSLGPAMNNKALTDPIIHVHGHCSRTGTAAHNERLGNDRAYNAALELLAAGLGDDIVKEVKGFGFRQPAAPNGTELGRAKNRRVVITIVNGVCAFVPKRRRGKNFSVRMLGGVDIGMGPGGGSYLIEITEMWSGQKRRFLFRGVGGTAGALPAGVHGKSTATKFTTTVPMFVEDFAGGGQIASASAKGGVVPGGVEATVLVFYCNEKPTQRVKGVGAGWGVSLGVNSFAGEWILVEPGSLLAE